MTIATNMAGRGTDIKLQPGVAELGGIHLIAVEPNESLRVDRQLIGRVGRQGDPGSYQFFISADDALLLRFGSASRQTDEIDAERQRRNHGRSLPPGSRRAEKMRKRRLQAAKAC